MNISITTQQVKAYVDEPVEIPVTAQNTDFTVSIIPTTGLTCGKNEKGDSVICTPAAAETYTVTITAIADTSKKVPVTVTVPELEITGKTELTLETEDAVTISFKAAGNWTAAANIKHVAAVINAALFIKYFMFFPFLL